MMSPFKRFFQFPVVEDQKKHLQVQWVTNPRLQQQILQRQQQTPQLQEALLAKQLFDEFRQNPQNTEIKEHWIAFLASFTWSAAREIKKDLVGAGLTTSKIELKDLFQLAMSYAFDPISFLKKFDSKRSQAELWYPALKAYTRTKMEGQLVDYVRSQAFKTFKRSSLGLAARATRKRVKDALTWQGQQSPLRDRYILAWQCFDEARKAKEINISSPKVQQFQKIADRYNQRRVKLPLAAEDNPSLNSQTIEKWLKEIGEAIRRYIEQPVTSLDDFQSGKTDCSILEGVVDELSTLNIERLEVRQQQELLNQFISEQLTTLGSELQRLLFLRYGLEIQQKIIAQILETQQSKISERCNQIIKQLIQTLIQQEWLGFNQSVSLNSETLRVLKANLEEILSNYYQDWFLIQIKNVFQSHPQLYQGFLNSEYEVLLKEGEISLVTLISTTIQRQFNVSLTSQNEAQQSLVKKIEECLRIVAYNL